MHPCNPEASMAIITFYFKHNPLKYAIAQCKQNCFSLLISKLFLFFFKLFNFYYIFNYLRLGIVIRSVGLNFPFLSSNIGESAGHLDILCLRLYHIDDKRDSLTRFYKPTNNIITDTDLMGSGSTTQAPTHLL